MNKDTYIDMISVADDYLRDLYKEIKDQKGYSDETKKLKRIIDEVDDLFNAISEGKGKEKMLAKVTECLTENLETTEGIEHLVWLQKNYCFNAGQDDNTVNTMDVFNDLMYGVDPLEVAEMVSKGSYSPDHYYWWYNEDGYIDSCEHGKLPSIINLGEMAKHIVENEDDLGDSNIGDILTAE